MMRKEEDLGGVDLERAKKVLEEGGYTCVLVNGETEYTSRERGIRPLLQFLEQSDKEGYSAADKVVGKAAAFLYVLMKVRIVYAQVISEPALEVFKEAKTAVLYDTCVKAIRNRTDTGFCPMESAVMDIKQPKEAYAVLKKKSEEMSRR